MRADQPKKPDWFKKHLPPGGKVERLERMLRKRSLNTVCHGAKCPNRNDCFHKGQATFLIMGNLCTRRCRFCSIAYAPPSPVDPSEAQRLAEAVQEMKLAYAVITSVTRDDLEDGGASCFAAVVQALEAKSPGIGVELLVPDFCGCSDALSRVMDAGPTVLNHNVETVPSLYPEVRPEAGYDRSLGLLERAASYDGIPVKSGLMLGLGESEHEVVTVLSDLRSAGVDIVTIGQYLQPEAACLEVEEYVEPERFEKYAGIAADLGFTGVASGPFVRSSYKAAALFESHLIKVQKT